MKMFDLARWAAVPFHFWTVMFFAFGCTVGSFLNVCIHRLPRGLSIVTPPSHCPQCGNHIPWYLNVPLLSWLWLRGRCRFCGLAIPVRYFLVEMLTGLLFLSSWLVHGPTAPALAFVYSIFLSGLVVATFIDLEHLIIPDAITVGGMGVAFVASFLAPALHGAASPVMGARRSIFGVLLGVGLVYGIVRMGKLLFGRLKHRVPAGTRVHFTEEALVLPGEVLPYGEVLYRRSDAIVVKAAYVEMVDRGYRGATVRLTRDWLYIDQEQFPTAQVPCLEVVADVVTTPREAMGLGDVKFMGAIGGFIGWAGVLFTLMFSALVGSGVGLVMIATGRYARSRPIPFGPYIALAAAAWVFVGDRVIRWWLGS
jgi:leader peptidase (prepilin peptidase)/N-methyltransferase